MKVKSIPKGDPRNYDKVKSIAKELRKGWKELAERRKK